MNESIINLVSVIISAVVALATIAAVFVALWQTKWPYRIKLIINCGIVEGKYQTDYEKFYKEKRLWIQIQNLGFTDASILRCGIKIDSKHKFNTQYFGTRLLFVKAKSVVRNSIPLVLFQDQIKNICGSKLQKKRLRIFAEDVSGKRFSQKLSLTVEQLLKMKPSDFESRISEEEYENYYFERLEFEPLESYLAENGFKTLE